MSTPFTLHDRSLPFKRMLWLIPIFLTLHNAEEALTMPAWVMTHLVLIKRIMPAAIDVQFTPAQLLCSLFLATAIPWIVTLFCINGEKGGAKLFLLFLLQAVVALNVIVPHIAASVRIQDYNPGVITAVCINLPFSVYLFGRAYREQFLSSRNFVLLFLTAIIVYGPVAWTLHSAGEWLAMNL